jgi:hypothetical protein
MCLYVCVLVLAHPEDDHMNGRNMSANIVQYNYYSKTKVPLSLLIYFVNLINTRNMEYNVGLIGSVGIATLYGSGFIINRQTQQILGQLYLLTLCCV